MSYPPTQPRPQPSIGSILSRNTDVTDTETLGSPKFDDLEFPDYLRPQTKPSQASFFSQETVAAPTEREQQKAEPDSEPWKSLAAAEEGELQGLKVEGDTLIVDWNGPSDPENPRNWTDKRKSRLVFICSCLAFGTPLASSMIAPGTGQLMEEFGLSSRILGSMVTSIFVLGFACGPLVLGPLSEVYGRATILQSSNCFFIIWNLVCGFAQTPGQLIAFRLLAGLGASTPLTVVGSALGDIYTPEQRGKAIAIFSLMPSLGPVVGPIVASWIAEKTSWRWIFWSSTIFIVLIQAGAFLIIRETYPPVLLGKKAKRVRKTLEERRAAQGASNGVIGYYAGMPIREITTAFGKTSIPLKERLGKALTRPFILFVCEPIIQALGLYMAFIYGLLYLALTIIPPTFKNEYGQSLGISGLHYIPLGIGLVFANYVNSRFVNPAYAYLKNKYGGVGRPEFRLPSILPGSIFLPLGLLLFGWAFERHMHWIVVDIGLVFLGMGLILVFSSIQMYVIDGFALHSASALACLACLRSLVGFGLPLAGVPMYSNLGQGIGNTVLACVAIALGWPAPLLLWFYGERLRKMSRFSKK